MYFSEHNITDKSFIIYDVELYQNTFKLNIIFFSSLPKMNKGSSETKTFIKENSQSAILSLNNFLMLIMVSKYLKYIPTHLYYYKKEATKFSYDVKFQYFFCFALIFIILYKIYFMRVELNSHMLEKKNILLLNYFFIVKKFLFEIRYLLA